MKFRFYPQSKNFFKKFLRTWKRTFRTFIKTFKIYKMENKEPSPTE